MRTIQRLNKAYENAKIESFNNESRYVFLSDCHRGDGSHYDEFTKNQNVFIHALNYYYKNNYVYVEVGDGDELWEQPRFTYIKNAHYDVFEVLKKFFYHDRMRIIYGNHNIYLKNKDYVKDNYYRYYNQYREQTYDFLKGLEPIESLLLKHEETNQEIFLVHGHQGDFANDHIWFLTMLSVKYFWRYMHALGIKSPASPVKNTFKRHKIEKNYNKWIDINRKVLICGHTHRFKFPKTGELPYFNTGCCTYPTSITAIELDSGSISIVSWKMRVNREGLLQARRKVIRGPESIEKFDLLKNNND